MWRIQYHRYGGPAEMKLEQAERPTPASGEIRVKVMAASSNPADGKVRSGMLRFVSGSKFPRGMGHDFAGIVDAVGPDVTHPKIGDAVFGISGIIQAGAFADYLLIAARRVVAKPPTVSFEQAAALPMAGVTAWSAIVTRADVQAGQKVFIAGCLGGIGRMAVQIALMRGAEVSGNCSASDRAEALQLGVSDVADYRAFDPASRKACFDVVFDTAGGLSMGQCAMMLKRGGVALHAVPSPGRIIAGLFSSRHKLASGEPVPDRLSGLASAAGQGKLVAKISRVVPLSEAIPAITELETTGLPKGKLVIVPAHQP